MRAALAALLLLALTLAPVNAGAQLVEVPLDAYVDSLRAAADALNALPAPPLIVPRAGYPECSGLPSGLPLTSIKTILYTTIMEAVDALENRDIASFRLQKFNAYLLISCYKLETFEAGLTVKALAYTLVAAEPTPAGSVYVAVPELGEGVPPGIPYIPPADLPQPTPPEGGNIVVPQLPGASGGAGGGGGGAGGGGGSGEAGIEAPQTAGGGGPGIDVDRLLEMLVRARNTSAGLGEGIGSVSLPAAPAGLPGLGPLGLALAAAAAIYASRGLIAAAPEAARVLAATLRGLLRGSPARVDGRTCYRIALAGAESASGVRKERWETPREYLGRVRASLDPEALRRLERATTLYEEEVYGGRMVEVSVWECRVGGRRGWLRPSRGRR